MNPPGWSGHGGECFAGRKGRLRALVVGGGIVALGYLPAVTAVMNSDIAWVLHVAVRWLDGARLYVDLIETNPPLVVWIYTPAVWIARVLRVSTYAAFLLWIGSLVGGALWLASRIVSRLEVGREPRGRRAFMLLLVAGVFLLAGRSFGQKDHLLLGLMLPYLLLVVARVERALVSPAEATTAGALAALGVCMKPHFLLLPVSLEVMRRLGSKRDRGLWRSETVTLVAGGVLYVVLVLIAMPAYLEAVARFGSLYMSYVQVGLAGILTRPATVLLAIGWLLWTLASERGKRRNLVLAFLVAGTALYVAAIIQLKGWSYHFLPSLALGAWAVATAATLRPTSRWRCRVVRGVGIGVSLALAVGAVWSVVTIATARSDEQTRLHRIAGRLSSCGRGDVLAVLSPRIDSAFPLVNRTGMRWGLRHNSQWALPLAIREQQRGVGEKTGDEGERSARAFWKTMRRETLDDLRDRPPAYLLVDGRAARVALGDQAPRLMEAYRSSPEYRDLLQEYRSEGTIAGYQIWRRNRPGDASEPCRGG